MIAFFHIIFLIKYNMKEVNYMEVLTKLNYKYILSSLIIFLLIISIIQQPSLAMNSAKEGLYSWFNILLPSLFPFLVLSDLVISLGIIDFFGKLLGSLMKPIFNVPGQGAFPFLMTLVSGYPVGAKLTSSLRTKKIITKTEADRLISFTSTSGPLFIIGAVAVGMLGNNDIGLLMLLPHYLGALTVGLLFRFYRANKYLPNHYHKSPLSRSSKTFNSQPSINGLGNIISKSVQDSMNSIILIGGFIIIYSVIIDFLLILKPVNQLNLLFSHWLNIPVEVLEGFISGLIELTTGCKKISSSDIILIHKILIINFLIAWGGLSIQSQALGFISNTDINPRIFICSKFLHGIISSIYTIIIYFIGYRNLTINLSSITNSMEHPNIFNSWIAIFLSSTKLALNILLIFIIFSLFTYFLNPFIQKEK